MAERFEESLRGFAEAIEREHEQQSAPIDWPARFRAAAEVAEREGQINARRALSGVADWLDYLPPHVVEAIERALMGEAP